MKIKIYQNLKGTKIGVGILFILVSVYMAYKIYAAKDYSILRILFNAGVFLLGIYLLITYKKSKGEIIEVEKYEIINEPGKINIEETSQ